MKRVIPENQRPSHTANGAAKPLPGGESASCRFIGIDAGAESLKLVELVRAGGQLRLARRQLIEHDKEPGERLRQGLAAFDWPNLQGAAASGRLSRQINLPRIPGKQAQARGFRFLFGNRPATIVSIGNHGFSVLELRGNGLEVLRENSRCSQGTGNFLCQLIERFSLTIAEADALCADIAIAAPLSGRCPVILKTDMTHLANKGENRAQILAGLFDAVCENVLCLIKPAVMPPDVYLIGGVSRSRRIQNTLRRALERTGMNLVPLSEGEALYLEALGCAVIAAERPCHVPRLDQLLLPAAQTRLESVAPLSDSLHRVRRMTAAPPPARNGTPTDLVLGFDIGSTGSKAVALDAATQTAVWEGYRQTLGNPVAAAQALLREFVDNDPHPSCIRAFGVTGSGREIVGSLMATCYGRDAVFILNEIAAHAEGALHYDPRVDTIFEIGGQDAKYIRLSEARVVDCAMNEACSAGTGSFIEEQGRKFAGIRDVTELGRAALKAHSGVSLGQHCSVFMAEVIDEAVAAGRRQSEIIAGLYDSIIQNYLHRVKGNRSVGRVIFCQGMPFSADALAAAVARQTGSQVIVPPNPGTVGALGIALLARRELPWQTNARLEAGRFLSALIEQKETFHCKSNVGCGGAGNRCRIDSIRTVVDGRVQRFTWGGGCSLHDKGTRKRKLPDLAPDPFREREELVRELTPLTAASAPLPCTAAPGSFSSSSSCSNTDNLFRRNGRANGQRTRKRVAISDEFMLKNLFPFFATFLHELGLEVIWTTGADQAALKRGVQTANVPFCAPLQLFHGLAGRMAESDCDFVFVPMVRATARAADEAASTVCPMVQGAPDILRWDLREQLEGRLVSPVINIGKENLESPEFLRSCEHTAAAFGLRDRGWRAAHRAGVRAQVEFERRCLDVGRRALRFCAEQNIVPVVVLGRPYTIYNKVLNSNVPALLREQGAIGIPVDCFPCGPETPVFEDIYWGYSQRVLRAAHNVRRLTGVYSLFCSNYACGPDSFGLHFYSYIMEGKPFAIIETDGHSGDAGTKTRIEAFLHCVEQDRRRDGSIAKVPTPANCELLPGGILPAPVESPRANGAARKPSGGDIQHSEQRPSSDSSFEEQNSMIEAGRVPQPHGSSEPLPDSVNTVPPHDLRNIQVPPFKLADFRRDETFLVPMLGPDSAVLSACLRGFGYPAETLPMPDAASLATGRRHTSGKECVPMCMTLGTLLRRLQSEPDPASKFVLVMPQTCGPCRFGVYNLLNRIVLERLGWRERVRIWSPKDSGYFDDTPPGFGMLLFAGFMAADLLLDALLDTRPREARPGAADGIHKRYSVALLQLCEEQARRNLNAGASLWQILSGRLFGVSGLLARAAAEFASVRQPSDKPTVLVAGEIYVRSVPFANDFIIEKLEARGCRTRLAPCYEWLDYADYISRCCGRRQSFAAQLTGALQSLVRGRLHAIMARTLAWPAHTTIRRNLAAAAPYLRPELEGEAVLTLGTPLCEWQADRIDAVISVGPLECMPNKVAEAQFFHIAEQESLPTLTLPLNGDPINAETLDNFVFEVHARRKARIQAGTPRPLDRRSDAHGDAVLLDPDGRRSHLPGSSAQQRSQNGSSSARTLHQGARSSS